MIKGRWTLGNGLPQTGFQSKNRRVMATICKQQIYLIPTVGIISDPWREYKIRICFAFLIFLVSFGFWRTRYARLSEEEQE